MQRRPPSFGEIEKYVKGLVGSKVDEAQVYFQYGVAPILKEMLEGDDFEPDPEVLMAAVNDFCAALIERRDGPRPSAPVVVWYAKLWSQDWIDDQQSTNARVTEYSAKKLAIEEAQAGKHLPDDKKRRAVDTCVKRLKQQRKTWERNRKKAKPYEDRHSVDEPPAAAPEVIRRVQELLPGLVNAPLPEMLPAGRCDVVAGSAGRFGLDKTSPIPADGNWYCSRLRCQIGHAFRFQRLGSVGYGPDGHMIDELELACSGGETRLRLFFDMYHLGNSRSVPADLQLGSKGGVGDAHRRDLLFDAETSEQS